MTDPNGRDPEASGALALSVAASAFAGTGRTFNGACSLLMLPAVMWGMYALAMVLLVNGTPRLHWALSYFAITALAVVVWQFLRHHATARHAAARQCFADALGLLTDQPGGAYEGIAGVRLQEAVRARINRLHRDIDGGGWLLGLLRLPRDQVKETLATLPGMSVRAREGDDTEIERVSGGERRAAAVLVDQAAALAETSAAFQAARIRTAVALGAFGVAAVAAVLVFGGPGGTWAAIIHFVAVPAGLWATWKMQGHAYTRSAASIRCLAESALVLVRKESGWQRSAAPDALPRLAERRADEIAAQAVGGERLLHLCGVARRQARP